ncbi:ATP-binding protein [Spirochaeta africana]|uniref:Anti-sigma regulatory factor (Ser/Thr protein kinase) n=1 Tax=Spirochaeta africana (strain ATCC 700263 / DSM 8902 / Z-7692) TaxID=889378 RepID=H9UMD0_SPIAZ|nr:ATP-binding protein [Spirochaeta africana]AFG38673.1 anti-sigma regulatory factor (Ser/Thr protein kinase) [Spirochaeta africana DSM 8902]
MIDNSPDFKEIKVDENSPLFDTKNMFYKEFPSDFRQIRYFTLLVVQKAPPSIKELNLLEQQISEIIKNAVKHGNKNDPNKKVKVWYYFSEHEARIIVEDEGEGFQEIDKWNEFNRKRIEAFQNQDFMELANYVSYRTARSDDNDGGNALFAALEYWNAGYVFSEKRNKVGAKKIFPKKAIGVDA